MHLCYWVVGVRRYAVSKRRAVTRRRNPDERRRLTSPLQKPKISHEILVKTV